jgi:hypothetical protein
MQGPMPVPGLGVPWAWDGEPKAPDGLTVDREMITN